MSAKGVAMTTHRFRRVWLSLLLLSFGLATAGCGGSSEPSAGGSGPVALATATRDPAAAPFSAVVATSELVVGPNRFALGILDEAQNRPIPDAQVRMRFVKLTSANQGTVKAEADGRFIAPARDAGIGGVVQHRHADGSNHLHDNADASVGVYIAPVIFDEPGRWAVQAAFRTPDGREGTVALPFEVLAQPTSPAVGKAAPRTRNLTWADVANSPDKGLVDTSEKPGPLLHETTVAEAIAQGKPALVAFVTPGYCSSRICGPSLEIVKKLVPAYGDKAALIHIEVFKDPANRVPSDAFAEWKLRTEPYFFVIDRQGNIAAKFEGPVSLAELEAALKQVTS